MYGHSFRITYYPPSLPSWVDLGIVIKERTYKDTGCTLILMIFLAYIESDAQNFRLIDGCLQTISSHFFAKYMNMFHKTDVQTIIFRSWTSLKLNWFKSYDTKYKYFSFPFRPVANFGHQHLSYFVLMNVRSSVVLSHLFSGLRSTANGCFWIQTQLMIKHLIL